jgi:hypothetical protein
LSSIENTEHVKRVLEIVVGPTADIYEYGVQPYVDDDWYRNHAVEKMVYHAASIRAANWILTEVIPTGDGWKYLRYTIRCPERGCNLGEVYSLPVREGQRYLAISNLVRGESRSVMLNWAFSDNWRCMPIWVPSTGRHGGARLNTGWLLELALLVDKVRAGLTLTDGQVDKMLPGVRKGLRRKIFTPPAEAWRPKRRS